MQPYRRSRCEAGQAAPVSGTGGAGRGVGFGVLTGGDAGGVEHDCTVRTSEPGSTLPVLSDVYSPIASPALAPVPVTSGNALTL